MSLSVASLFEAFDALSGGWLAGLWALLVGGAGWAVATGWPEPRRLVQAALVVLIPGAVCALAGWAADGGWSSWWLLGLVAVVALIEGGAVMFAIVLIVPVLLVASVPLVLGGWSPELELTGAVWLRRVWEYSQPLAALCMSMAIVWAAVSQLLGRSRPPESADAIRARLASAEAQEGADKYTRE